MGHSNGTNKICFQIQKELITVDHISGRNCNCNESENVTLVKKLLKSLESLGSDWKPYTQVQLLGACDAAPRAMRLGWRREGGGRWRDGCVRADADDDALTLYAQKSYSDIRLIGQLFML